MIGVVIFGGMIATLLICLSMQNRIQRVYDFRTELVRRIHEINQAEIQAGRLNDWMWRYDELNTVDFDEMMYKFWRPLTSFYPRDPARIEK